MTNTIINGGKVNWNSKSAKDFRANMAIYKLFEFELADLQKKKGNEIRNAQGIIATNQELIDKKSFGQHDKTYYEAQIAQMKQNIADSEKRLADWKAEQEKNVKKVEEIFTKDLYKAYVASINDDVNAWRVSGYTQALADMLASQGITPAWDTLNTLYNVNRERPSTGSNKAETGLMMQAQTERTWRKSLMSKICDLMGDILPKYKFLHILTKAEKKAQKKAQVK